MIFNSEQNILQTLAHWLIMKTSVNLMSSLVCMEFLLYMVCLCIPQWLVNPEGQCEGLFAICNTFEGLSSCTTFPAWMGECVLHHIFLFCRADIPDPCTATSLYLIPQSSYEKQEQKCSALLLLIRIVQPDLDVPGKFLRTLPADTYRH